MCRLPFFHHQYFHPTPISLSKPDRMPAFPSCSLLLLLLLLLVSSRTNATSNRRSLQETFFPTDPPPPSSVNGFFPSIPSPPPPPSPPSPSTVASNVSSLSIPQSPKANSVSFKLLVVGLVVFAALIAAIGLVICLRRKQRQRRSFLDGKTTRPNKSSRVSHPYGFPKPWRSPSTSSEFVYFENVVDSHPIVNNHVAPNRPGETILRKLKSPELRPLPPLEQLSFRRKYANNIGSDIAEEEDVFYSPRGSSQGRESSIGTTSASRRDFASAAAENFDASTESSSSSSYPLSNSGSPTPSASFSSTRSPPISLSPRSLRLESPALVAVQTAPLPLPLRTQRSVMVQFANLSRSPSPSPPSSPSPDRDSERSLDSSPRSSNYSTSNAGSPVKTYTVYWGRLDSNNNPSEYALSENHVENGDSPALIINGGLNQFTTRWNPLSPSVSSSLSSPERPLGENRQSPLFISNSLHQNMESPARLESTIQKPVPVSTAPPPPPPPLPPPPGRLRERLLSSPSIGQPTFKPPVPSRPVPLHSPLISPIKLPPTSESPQKPKLKPLHWDKVRASCDRETVWDQLKSSSFVLNEKMFETLFVVDTPTWNSKESSRRPSVSSTNQENRVLDPKKAQNIAISLRALNVNIDEVCEALLDGNADALGTDLLESLLKMAPTKEEERRLKEYKDDSPFKLGPAERFLKAVLDIPFAFKRVEAMLYVSNFESEVECLKKSFDTLEASCEELRNCRMFLKLLDAVLKTGNRMNTGTNRGDAHAFKLDTLLKLVDVKGADGKTTLLHFVVQEIIRTEGARFSGRTQNPNTALDDDAKCRKIGLQVVSGLTSDLKNVKKAAAMDSDVLISDVTKLSQGIESIGEIVRLNEEMGSIGKFSESMNRFKRTAEEEITRIRAQESVALALVKEITEYFHGNSAKEEAHPFRIFMVVRDFLTILDRVCKEVGMINQQTVIGSSHKIPVPASPMLEPLGSRLPRSQN